MIEEGPACCEQCHPGKETVECVRKTNGRRDGSVVRKGVTIPTEDPGFVPRTYVSSTHVWQLIAAYIGPDLGI